MTVDRMKVKLAATLGLLATIAVFALAIGAATAHAQKMPELMVKDAWARPPLAPQNNTAVYMTIENPGTVDKSIVSVTSKKGSPELHETQMDGKMMKMVPIKSLAVPAKGSVELKPGGYHIMLSDIKGTLKPGDEINLALKLDDGKSIPVTAMIRANDASTDPAGKGMPMPAQH